MSSLIAQCIKHLYDEIDALENGLYDDRLHEIVSYPVPIQYMGLFNNVKLPQQPTLIAIDTTAAISVSTNTIKCEENVNIESNVYNNNESTYSTINSSNSNDSNDSASAKDINDHIPSINDEIIQSVTKDRSSCMSNCTDINANEDIIATATASTTATIGATATAPTITTTTDTVTAITAAIIYPTSLTSPPPTTKNSVASTDLDGSSTKDSAKQGSSRKRKLDTASIAVESASPTATAEAVLSPSPKRGRGRPSIALKLVDSLTSSSSKANGNSKTAIAAVDQIATTTATAITHSPRRESKVKSKGATLTPQSQTQVEIKATRTSSRSKAVNDA